RQLAEPRRAIWTFYERLNPYARDPTEAEKAALWRDFHALFDPNSGSVLLDCARSSSSAKSPPVPAPPTPRKPGSSSSPS
ncbi:MAG: hypothetical protein H0T73_15690, partial [Ardenticatenales bacterium]|nr:hypothetical protein [Ardenticatenales bacterium]